MKTNLILIFTLLVFARTAFGTDFSPWGNSVPLATQPAQQFTSLQALPAAPAPPKQIEDQDKYIVFNSSEAGHFPATLLYRESNPPTKEQLDHFRSEAEKVWARESRASAIQAPPEQPAIRAGYDASQPWQTWAPDFAPLGRNEYGERIIARSYGPPQPVQQPAYQPQLACTAPQPYPTVIMNSPCSTCPSGMCQGGQCVSGCPNGQCYAPQTIQYSAPRMFSGGCSSCGAGGCATCGR